MPVRDSSEFDIDKRTISSLPSRFDQDVTAVATISLHPAEGYDRAAIRLSVAGKKNEPARNLKQVLGVAGESTSHHARASQSSYEVPSENREKVLKKLGLPEGLGGRQGVTITFSHDTANNGISEITIEARDPKLAKFQTEHVDKLEVTLAKTPGMVPDTLKAEIMKNNPGLAARIQLEPAYRGGTRIEFTTVEEGNSPFSIRHNARTGLDEIVFPVTNNPRDAKDLHTMAWEHLKANGVSPAGSNIDAVIRTATAQKESPAPYETHIRTGGIVISLPQGSGEKALTALSRSAEFKVGDVHHHSKPFVAAEIARAAIPEMNTVVRPVAVAERAAYVASPQQGWKNFDFGNLLTRLGVAAVTATGAGVAAAAQAPEGQRLEAGGKAAAISLAEGALPGVTKNDFCEKVADNAAAIGGALGGVVGGGGAILATGATAAPTLGASVVASPWTTAAGVVLGGIAGSQAGEIAGEKACNFARDGINAARQVVSQISIQNLLMMKHAPTTQTVASNKAPDSVSVIQAATHGHESRS